MSEFRAGYDVVEALYLEEVTFGVTPTAGEWQQLALVNNFDCRPRPVFKEKIGIGRQLPSEFVLIKKYAEWTIEHELLAKDTWEWIDFWYYIITNAAFGATFALGKRLKSFSLGCKLDLATDEFWWLKGCKPTRYEIRSDGVEQVLKGIATGFAQAYDYGTTDYVTPPATRQSAITTAYLKHADADIELDSGGGFASIFDRLNSWSLIIERSLARRGTSSIDPLLYRYFAEERANLTLRLNLDFNSRVELEQFIDATEIDARVSIPTGSGGRTVTLANGKWLEHSSPHREIDLIAIDLTAKWTDLNVATL